MKIKTQFRINIFVSICLAVVVAGILIYAAEEIDRETEKNFLADRISKGVFELLWCQTPISPTTKSGLANSGTSSLPRSKR